VQAAQLARAAAKQSGPRYFFHYWEGGAAKLLAENVKAALALTAAK